MIEVQGQWFFGLREGYCSFAYWTTRNVCCKIHATMEGCDAWVYWSQHFGFSLATQPQISGIINFCMYMMFSLSFSLIACALTIGYAPFAAGSGMPQLKVILSGFVIHKNLGKWTLLIRALTIPMATAAGIGNGRAGPLVHVSAAVGNVVSSYFPKYARNATMRRTMIAAASSAGVCMAFSAPLGGILFVLEEVAYYFPPRILVRGLVCSLVSIFVLLAVNHDANGKVQLFQVAVTRVKWKLAEIPFFVAIGAFGGLFGAFFCRFNTRLALLRKHTKLKLYPKTEVFVVTFIAAFVSFWSPFLHLADPPVLAALFRHCVDRHARTLQCVVDDSSAAFWAMLSASMIRMLLMTFTMGLRLTVAAMMPALAAGACFGRAFGAIVDGFFAPTNGLFGVHCNAEATCVDHALYALLGAGAAVAGVTRMKLSLIVIMFEIGGGLTYLTPIILVALVSNFVSESFGTKEDLFAELIRIDEFPFLNPKVEIDLHDVVGSVMRPANQLVTVPELGNTLGSLEALLAEYDHHGFPVITSQNGVVGLIHASDLRTAVSAYSEVAPPEQAALLSNRMLYSDYQRGYIDFRPIMDPTPVCVVDTTPFSTVCEIMRKTGVRYVLVLKDGLLGGLITRKDVQIVMLAHEQRMRAAKKNL